MDGLVHRIGAQNPDVPLLYYALGVDEIVRRHPHDSIGRGDLLVLVCDLWEVISNTFRVIRQNNKVRSIIAAFLLAFFHPVFKRSTFGFTR